MLAIIFLRLPNMYIAPGFNTAFLTTQAVSRVILVGMFFISFLLFKKTFFQKNRSILILLGGFFLCSSLSIIWAQNVALFFNSYKDFLVAIMAFFVFNFFQQEKKKIAITLIITMPLTIFYQMLLLYGGNAITFLKEIIYERHFSLVLFNLQRQRIYLDVYDEAFLPLLILYIKKKNYAGYLSGFIIFLISLLALLSNFRTRILMFLIGFFSSIILLYRISIKKILYGFIFLIFIGMVASFSSFSTFTTTFYNRFLFEDKREDVDTIFSRLRQIQSALEMGFVSPLGAGLGNYYVTLSYGKTPNLPFISQTEDVVESLSAVQNLHNNFATVIAESGYIAFIFYSLLLIQFGLLDRKTLQGKDQYKKAFVLSFWLLFFFGLFNPTNPGSYQILFWGLRGLLA